MLGVRYKSRYAEMGREKALLVDVRSWGLVRLRSEGSRCEVDFEKEERELLRGMWEVMVLIEE